MESSMPSKQMSLNSLLALLWKPLWSSKFTEFCSMDPNSRLDRLQFSAYYDVETAPTSANIHTTSSMDWSLLCEELSMSSLSCKMMTTTRRQSQKVSIVWKPPWPSSVATPIMEVNSDTMDPSCRLDKTAFYLVRDELASTPNLPNRTSTPSPGGPCTLWRLQSTLPLCLWSSLTPCQWLLSSL